MDMLAALRLQIEWGADEALENAPVDRLAPAPPSLSRVAAIPSKPVPPRLPPVALAEAAAGAANTIEALRQVLAAFTGCALAATATRLVFADGDPRAGLVVIGEVPGAEEDRAGCPFIGPAGQLLDRMFATIGLRRADMLLTDLIPWRPPGGRPPTETEVQICLPFLRRHLTLLRPRLVVMLGALPTRALSGRDDGIRRLRGRWLDLAVPGLPATIPALPMMHPHHLMRTPAAKREAWQDLLTLRKGLDTL